MRANDTHNGKTPTLRDSAADIVLSRTLQHGEKPVKDRLLVAAKDAAEMCGKSLRTWRSWDAGGLVPQPVRISRSTLWSVDELREWVAAGCPRREDWEARR